MEQFEEIYKHDIMNSLYPCSIENYVYINKIKKVLHNDYRESISFISYFFTNSFI